ncbi:MAG: GlsB/YeaQ/YmgE family stress response membrane protein [Calothrix sp. SM1_7_51]|nr:GlsB/YeaQ/YmgE family stress response membrane protein [Calothrix sp. SM1_7_51]
MNILTWLVLGLIAGAIAKAIYPGRQGGGIFATIFLGIIGAFIGGTLATFIQTGSFQVASANLSFTGILLAILGSIIAIFLWGLVARRAA